MRVAILILTVFSFLLTFEAKANDGGPISQIPLETKRLVDKLKTCVENTVTNGIRDKELVAENCHDYVVAIEEKAPNLSEFIIRSATK